MSFFGVDNDSASEQKTALLSLAENGQSCSHMSDTIVEQKTVPMNIVPSGHMSDLLETVEQKAAPMNLVTVEQKTARLASTVEQITARPDLALNHKSETTGHDEQMTVQPTTETQTELRDLARCCTLAQESFEEYDRELYHYTVDTLSCKHGRLYGLDKHVDYQRYLLETLDGLADAQPGSTCVATSIANGERLEYSKIHYLHHAIQDRLFYRARNMYDRMAFLKHSQVCTTVTSIAYISPQTEHDIETDFMMRFQERIGDKHHTITVYFSVKFHSLLSKPVFPEEKVTPASNVGKVGVTVSRKIKNGKPNNRIDSRHFGTYAHTECVDEKAEPKEITIDILSFPDHQGDNTVLVTKLSDKIAIVCYQLGDNTVCPLHTDTMIEDVSNIKPKDILGVKDCILCAQLEMNITVNQHNSPGLPLRQPKAHMAFGNSRFQTVTLTVALHSTDKKERFRVFERKRNGTIRRFLALNRCILEQSAYLLGRVNYKLCCKEQDNNAKSLAEQSLQLMLARVNRQLRDTVMQMWDEGEHLAAMQILQCIDQSDIATLDEFTQSLTKQRTVLQQQEEANIKDEHSAISTWCLTAFGLTGTQVALVAASITNLLTSIISYCVNGGTCALLSVAAAIGVFVCSVCLIKQIDVSKFETKIVSIGEELVTSLVRTETRVEESISECPPLVKQFISGAIVLLVVFSATKIMNVFPSTERMIASVNKISQFNHHSIPFLSTTSNWISSLIFGDQSDTQILTDSYLKLIERATELLKHPPSFMFERVWVLEDMKKLSKEMLIMLGNSDKRHGLHLTLQNTQKALEDRIKDANDAISSAASRQVPVCMVFHGPEGIGKTTAKNNMCMAIKRRRYDNHPGSIYNINATEKYFKTYHGEPIVTVQEMLSTFKATDDLIMTHLTSMVSTDAHNMQGASVEGKEQMLRCHGMYIDTNANPNTIKTQLSQCVQEHTISPWLQRVTFVECAWNLNPEDLRLPRNERPYDSRKYTHIRFRIQRYKSHSGKQEFIYVPKEVMDGTHTEYSYLQAVNEYVLKINLREKPFADFRELVHALLNDNNFYETVNFAVPTTFDITFDDLLVIEQHQYEVEKANYERSIATTLDNAEEAGVQKHHMVVNVHGPIGIGKTDTIIKDICLTANSSMHFSGHLYDYEQEIKPEHKNEPCIFICDDVILHPTPFREQAYIQWYNSLPNNSLIIFVSNHIPKKHRTWGVYDSGYKSLPFTIPTFYRRAGFDGKFIMPDGSVNIATNAHSYYTETTSINVNGEVLSGTEFAKFIFTSYVAYLKNGFKFNVKETPNIPEKTPDDIYLFSPSMAQLKQDINGMRSITMCIAGLTPTKISLNSKNRDIFAERGSVFLSTVPKTKDPIEIVTYYAKAIRTMGITDNIYCEIGDMGKCVVVKNTLYSNVAVSSLKTHVSFNEERVVLHGYELDVEQAARIVCDSSLENINANMPLITTLERSRIIEWLNEPKRKDRFVAFVRNNNVDPEFEHMKKSQWSKISASLPWIATAIAGVGALILIISGLMPTISRTTVYDWVKKEVDAHRRGYSIDIPIAVKHSPYYAETRFDVLEEAKRTPRAPREKVRREKDTDSGSVRDKLKTIPRDMLHRINKDLDAYMAGEYQGDNHDEYRRLRFNDQIYRNFGIELSNDEEGYSGPSIGRSKDPYKAFYEDVISRNIVAVGSCDQMISYGIAVFGKCIVAPIHVVNKIAGSPHITTTIDGVDKLFRCDLLHVMKGRDLAVLEVVDKTCPMFRDISFHFCEPEDIRKHMHIATALPRGGTNYCLDHGSLFNIIQEPMAYSPEAVTKYKDFIEVAVHNRNSVPGDCGSPYLIHVRGKCKIVGIHTTGSTTTTTASIITTSDMDELYKMRNMHRLDVTEEVAEAVFEKKMMQLYDEPIQLEPSSYIASCIQMIQHDDTTYGEDIFPLSGDRIQKIKQVPIDTSIVSNQKLYMAREQYGQLVADLGRSVKIPIISDYKILAEKPDLLKDGLGRPSQIMTNVNYLQLKYPSKIDPVVRQHLVGELHSFIKHTFPHGLEFLSEDQTINGCELVDGSHLRSMDMSTSSGYFVKNNLALGTKRQVFDRIDVVGRTGDKVAKYVFNDTAASKSVKAMYYYTLGLLKKGQPPPHLFCTTRKIELLHRDKAHKGRVFETPNMEFTMAERNVFGALMASMSKWDPTSPICVGMNVANNFNDLFKQHANFPLHGAADFVKWDKTLPWELVSILHDAIARLNTEWSKAACTLLYTLFHSNRVIGNTIYNISDSIPSGSATTAPLNSLINYTIDLYVFSRLVAMWPISHIQQVLLSSNYGDDKFLSWSNEIAEEFDMVKYKKIVEEEIGMRMDSDKKDGTMVPFTTNMEDLSFLSRTPKYYSGIGWLGALKKESVLASLYWAKKKCDTLEFVQHAWDEALLEAARHSPTFYGQLSDCYSNVSRSIYSPSALRPPASYEANFKRLFVGAVEGVEYSIVGHRLNQKEEAMNSQPNMEMMQNVQRDDHLARMQGSGSSTGKLEMPHMGMSQQEILLQATPMMNGAQVVDDKNDTTAVSMNAPAMEQMVPDRFRFDIWSSLFTSNIFINRQYIGADTPIDTIIFNYSSDPASDEFPTNSAAITFVKQLLLAHKYSVTDFRVKVKLVAATGTIGRLLVAVVPVDYQIAPAEVDSISTSLKGSGYDYSEISANGDSTYVACLRPYVNRGFASVSNNTGAGQLVENVRVIAVISETFGTTFSEQPPNVAVTTEFSFGEGFEMSIPLTTLPALINNLAPAQRRNKEIVNVANRARFLVGSNQILRIGSSRSPVFTDLSSQTPLAQIPELGGKFTPFLNMNDVWCTLPAYVTSQTNGSFPLFMRGTLPIDVTNPPVPKDGESLLEYIERWFTSSQTIVEIHSLLNSAGEKALPITYDQVTTRQAFTDLGYTLAPSPDGDPDLITDDYVFRGIVVRSGLTYATIFWAEYKDLTPSAVGGIWKYATVPCTTVDAGSSTQKVVQTGPTFLPTSLGFFSVTSNPYDQGQAFTFSRGGYDPQFLPQYSTQEDARVPFVIGTSVTNANTDSTYKPLTFTDASYSILPTTGTGGIPSEVHSYLVDKILSRGANFSFVTFDIVAENGTLIAHAGVDINGNLLVNIDRQFVYREFSGPIYITGVSDSYVETLLPTPSDSWQSYAAPQMNKKFGAGKKTEAGILTGIAGGILGGIGNSLSASQEHKYDLENKQKEYEYQQMLNKMQNQQQTNVINQQGDITRQQYEQRFGYDKDLSNQGYEQQSALSGQSFNQAVQLRGLADPSQLNKPTANTSGGLLHSTTIPKFGRASINVDRQEPPALPKPGNMLSSSVGMPRKLNAQMVRARSLPYAKPSKLPLQTSSGPSVAFNKNANTISLRGVGSSKA